MGSHVVVAMGHQRPNRGGGGVKRSHPVPAHQVPVPARGRVQGGGLKHHRGAPVQEGPVHDVRVAGDPAAVCHAGVHVVWSKTERLLWLL